MEKKSIYIVGAIIIMVLFISKMLLTNVSKHGNIESISNSIQELKTSNALADIGISKNSDKIQDIVKTKEIVAKDVLENQAELTFEEVKLKEKRIVEIYQMDQRDMHNYFNEIKENQKQIIKWKSENGISVTALENTDPAFALTLSTIVNRPVEEAVEINRADLGFTTHEWYFVKTFTESGDLEKLMSQGKLNEEHVNIKTLTVAYSNNPPMVYRDDGKVDGLPKAEEDLQDSINEDDDQID